jgi:hypothetical protein
MVPVTKSFDPSPLTAMPAAYGPSKRRVHRVAPIDASYATVA